jgi:hypothetical protein
MKISLTARDTVIAHRFVSTRPSRTFEPGRICKEYDCTTELSIYNGGEHCAIHAKACTPRMRGFK